MAEKKSNNYLLPFVAALLTGLLLFSGTAAGVVVSMDPSVIALSPGERRTINLTLDSTPMGLSGYAIGIKIEQPGIAEVTAVTYPSWAGLSDSEGIPGSDVQIMAVDLEGKVKKNATQVILATLTIHGKGLGTTPVLLYGPDFDDGEGYTITPTLASGSVTVSSSGSALSGGSAAGSGGGGSSTMPGAVTSPSQNQSGAETTVQVTTTGENQTPVVETPAIGGTAIIPPTPDDQAIPGTPAGQGIPFLSLPLILAVLGFAAYVAVKKR